MNLMPKLTLEQHELRVLYEMVEVRLQGIKDTIEKNFNDLDVYERDITNYTTYDLYCKLGGVANAN